MFPQSLSFKLVRLLAITTVLVGCTFLCWGVSFEYFNYKTNSVIAIEDYPKENVRLPGILTCVRIEQDLSIFNVTIGEVFTGEENYFNDKDDSWKEIGIWPRLSPEEKKRMKLVTKKYLIEKRYCYFFQIDSPFRMAELTSYKYTGLPLFFEVDIGADPLYSPKLWGTKDKECNAKYLYVSLVMNQSSISNERTREFLKEVCTKGFTKYLGVISYSSLVSVRLPPPYDSNCRDYQNEGPYLSSHECYDYCLQEKTKKWNMVPSETLIDRKAYDHSQMYRLSEELLEKRFLGDIKDEILEKHRQIANEWSGIKRSCRESCDRPDCRTEDISPDISYFEGVFKFGNETLSKLCFFLTQSYQPTLEVTTIPRQKLLDYIIYMASMLSFWIGFCPLTLADLVIEKFREFTKKKRIVRIETVRHNERIRQLERGLIRVIANQERIYSILDRISNRLRKGRGGGDEPASSSTGSMAS